MDGQIAISLFVGFFVFIAIVNLFSLGGGKEEEPKKAKSKAKTEDATVCYGDACKDIQKLKKTIEKFKKSGDKRDNLKAEKLQDKLLALV